MVDSASLRRTITEKLSRVQDLGDGIFRGERIYQGKTFATAYIDLSDSVIQRAANLAKFQEGLLGSEFFTADGDQRWNSYLYFWAGPQSQINDRFWKQKLALRGIDTLRESLCLPRRISSVVLIPSRLKNTAHWYPQMLAFNGKKFYGRQLSAACWRNAREPNKSN